MTGAYAHAMRLISARPQSDLWPIFEEAGQLRALLLSDVRALIRQSPSAPMR